MTRLHRYGELILAHDDPASMVIPRRRRPGASSPVRPKRRFGSAFCLMQPPPATAPGPPRR
nr:hypothetical protein [Burkholderia alba]